jgi:DNA-binding NtrC family response regulator
MKNETPGMECLDKREESSHSPARRILVVEDDTEVRRAVAQMLDQLGYLSVPCSHAQEALDHVQSQKFDLLLIDYRMPDMTGLDLILMLRQESLNVPIIMMTGYSATEDRISSEKLGVFAVLKKPIAAPQLAKTVKDCLEASAQKAPASTGKQPGKTALIVRGVHPFS